MWEVVYLSVCPGACLLSVCGVTVLAPLSPSGSHTQLCGVVHTWREGMASQGTLPGWRGGSG